MYSYLPGDTKSNIVREDCSFVDIIMAMNCINAINHGNAKASLKSALLKLIYHIHPILRGGIRFWYTPSTTQ